MPIRDRHLRGEARSRPGFSSIRRGIIQAEPRQSAQISPKRKPGFESGFSYAGAAQHNVNSTHPSDNGPKRIAIPGPSLAGAFVRSCNRAVYGFDALSNSAGELTVSWNAPSDTPLDYRIAWARASESYRLGAIRVGMPSRPMPHTRSQVWIMGRSTKRRYALATTATLTLGRIR